MNRVEADKAREACRALVRKRALWSAGGAVLPVPLLDVVVDASVLMQLIPEINQAFGLAPEQLANLDEDERARRFRLIRQRGSQLIGIVVTRAIIRRSLLGFAGRIAARQVAKFIPLGGQLLAAGMGYWVLREMAYRHVEDCYAVALASMRKSV